MPDTNSLPTHENPVTQSTQASTATRVINLDEEIHSASGFTNPIRLGCHRMMSSIRPRHWLTSQLLAAFLASTPAPATGQNSHEAPIRIACLGDSITFGAQIADREHSSYPGWLNGFLGQNFEVRNFGVGGTTLLTQADRPYVQTKAYRNSLDWKPDIAVIILGTNDTCQNGRRKNWQHAKSLATDAGSLIATLHSQRPDMRIILCSPTPMFPARKDLKPERKVDLEARSKRLATCAAAARHRTHAPFAAAHATHWDHTCTSACPRRCRCRCPR